MVVQVLPAWRRSPPARSARTAVADAGPVACRGAALATAGVLVLALVNLPVLTHRRASSTRRSSATRSRPRPGPTPRPRSTPLPRLPGAAAAGRRVRRLPMGLHGRSARSRPDRTTAGHAGPAAARQRRRDGPAVRARRPLPGRRGRRPERSPRSPGCSAPTPSGCPGDVAFDRFRTRPPRDHRRPCSPAAAAATRGWARPCPSVSRRQRARRADGRRAVAVRSTRRPARAAGRAGAGARPRGGHPGQGPSVVIDGCRRRDRRQRRGRADRRPRADPLQRLARAADDLAVALRDADQVLITDSNRDRAHHWRSSQDVTGFTESGGPGSDVLRLRRAATSGCPCSQRLRPGTQTIAVQEGPVTATASSYGEPFAYRPEDRPLMADRRRPDHAWLVADRAPAEGQRIRFQVAEPDRPRDAAPAAGSGRASATSARSTIAVDGRAPAARRPRRTVAVGRRPAGRPGPDRRGPRR